MVGGTEKNRDWILNYHRMSKFNGGPCFGVVYSYGFLTPTAAYKKSREISPHPKNAMALRITVFSVMFNFSAV